MLDDYLTSRYDLISLLADQVSMSTSEPLYDKNGTLSRAILAGISKADIEKFLSKHKIYTTNVELISNTSLVTDPIEKANLLVFKDFYEAVQNVQDPDNAVSFRRTVADRISSYKDSDGALLVIEEGGSPKEIFEALKDSEQWKDHSRDFLSRSYVDLPSREQILKWTDFGETVNYIKDLKHFN